MTSQDKETATGSGPGVSWGSTGMQGWRVSMEDAPADHVLQKNGEKTTENTETYPTDIAKFWLSNHQRMWNQPATNGF